MADTPRTPPRRPAPALGSDNRSPWTPRRHKTPYRKSIQGTKPRTTLFTRERVKADLKEKLGLAFEPDDWQAEVISRALRGYDGIFCAGTGYGKSLIFQGLAKLGGDNKAIIVICPLKALEADQVREAEAKGIRAVMINEDNSKTIQAWADARTRAQMIYLSPEMALADSFTKLWRDGTFRARLQAVVIDEAHCIDEWGQENFRKQYRQLNRLREYASHSVPFLACTATCSTSTFNVLWDTLGYGYRPFWGIDVGCDRPNLLFDIRPIANKANPVIDILNILPPVITSETTLDDIPKTILYFDSENACLQAKNTLRKCLPAHLRDAVYAFSSSISEKAKNLLWERFRGGSLRVLCATDAAGMGCNVPDIRYVVIVGCPKSLSVVAQRWGRAGRDRSTAATCLLLVPPWAFRPDATLSAAVHPALKRLRDAGPAAKGQAKKRSKGRSKADNQAPKVESKANAARRARLPLTLEQFINVGVGTADQKCAHAYLCQVFRPDTQLTTFHTLDHTNEPSPSHIGKRSRSSAFEITWTILDLKRIPNASRCCMHCSPCHEDLRASSSGDDPRLAAFASDFAAPLAQAGTSMPGGTRSRSDTASTSWSAASQVSTSSRTSSYSTTNAKHPRIPMDEKEILRASLLQWRDMYQDPKRDYVFMSKAVDFPSSLIEKLINRCAEFLTSATVQPGDVLKVITWSSASPKELEEVAKVIASWRERLAILATPASQRRASERARMVTAEALPPLAAPVFDSPQTPTNSQSCSPGAGHARGPQNITRSLSSRPAATSPPQRLLSISQTPSTPLFEEDPFSAPSPQYPASGGCAVPLYTLPTPVPPYTPPTPVPPYPPPTPVPTMWPAWHLPRSSALTRQVAGYGTGSRQSTQTVQSWPPSPYPYTTFPAQQYSARYPMAGSSVHGGMTVPPVASIPLAGYHHGTSSEHTDLNMGLPPYHPYNH